MFRFGCVVRDEHYVEPLIGIVMVGLYNGRANGLIF
jgi:hypothetical protein